MMPFEKEVIDRLGRIEEKIDNDFRILHGTSNDEGLIRRVGKLESRLQSVTEGSEYQRKFLVTAGGLAGFLLKFVVDLVLCAIR